MRPSLKELREHLLTLNYLWELDIDVTRADDGSAHIRGKGIDYYAKTTKGGKSFLTRLSNKILNARVNEILSRPTNAN